MLRVVSALRECLAREGLPGREAAAKAMLVVTCGDALPDLFRRIGRRKLGPDRLALRTCWQSATRVPQTHPSTTRTGPFAAATGQQVGPQSVRLEITEVLHESP
jgi:hypothetical protein